MSAHPPEDAAPTDSPEESSARDEAAPLDATSFDEALAVLEQIAANHALLDQMSEEARTRLRQACGRIAAPTKEAKRALSRARRKRHSEERREHDRQILDQTGMRRQREAMIYPTPDPSWLEAKLPEWPEGKA